MPDTDKPNIGASFLPPPQTNANDIYFEAVSINPEPIEAGSDQFFDIASNPAPQGEDTPVSIGAFELVPFVDNGVDKVYVAPGSVNGEFATGTGQSNAYTLSASTTEFYVECNLDASTQAVTSCSIVTSQPTDSLTVAGYGIGTASESLITQGHTGSLSLISCGVNHFFS